MKENKGLINTSSLIVLILIGIVVLVTIVKILNCCIPEAAKFDVNIWGNVSEWFTFLVALTGSVFVYKTLDSQMKVQRDQSRLTDVELKKHRYSIKPEFKFNITYGDVWTDPETGLPCELFYFNVKSTQSTVFTINLYEDSYLELEAQNLKYTHIQPSQSSILFQTPNNEILIPAEGLYIPLSISINYHDKEYNCYLLKLKYYLQTQDNGKELLNANYEIVSDRYLGA